MLVGNAAANQPKLTWDGNNITLVGTLRQTLAGATITDYVDRGTWAVATAYAVNDLVQHASGGNTSTYKCLVAHTSADPAGSDGTTGTPNVASISAVPVGIAASKVNVVPVIVTLSLLLLFVIKYCP